MQDILCRSQVLVVDLGGCRLKILAERDSPPSEIH